MPETIPVPGADAPLTDDDLLLLTRLQAAQEANDPMPEGMLERIHFRIALQAMEAELATIADQDLAFARGGSTKADTITFTSSTISLTVMIAEEDTVVRIDGWVTGGGLQIDLVGDFGTWPRTSDATGRMVWTDVPHGSIHFLIHPARADARLVATPVVEV